MENKRLYRSQKSSVFGGVCGGLADYFNTEPVLIRILFVIAFFAGGGGLLVYIVLWIITPLEQVNIYKTNNIDSNSETKKEEVKTEYMEEQKKHKNEGSLWGGVILIALGAIFLIDRFVKNIDFGDLWPLILVAIGIVLISQSIRK